MKFCDYYMHERPFDDDVKSVRTHWHEYPATYPIQCKTRLWVMDDWRMMIVILKSNIDSFNKNGWREFNNEH